MDDYAKLLRLSAKRRVSDKQFLHLYNQLAKVNPMTEHVFISLFESNIGEEYLIALSLDSEENLKMFWQAVTKLADTQQVHILKGLQSRLKTLDTSPRAKFVDQLVAAFIDYSEYALTLNHESLLNELIFNWDLIITKLGAKEKEPIKKFMVKFLDHLNANGYSKQFHYCSKFVNNKSNISLQPNLNNLSISQTTKNYGHFENIKIFYFFNQMFTTFNVMPNESLYQKFNKLFDGNCYKLIYSVFNGIYLCDKSRQSARTKDNWLNFLSSRLPRLILMYKVDNLDEIIFKLFASFESLDDNFKQFFIKSLIFNKILSIKSFHKFFPNENRINQQTLIHEMSNMNTSDKFNEVLDDKLYKINCEFLSVEESGIVEYFDAVIKKVEFSMSKQLELVRSIEELFDLLVNELAFEKLNRLVLILLHNKKLFDLYVFNLCGNYKTIYRLTKVIDNDFKLSDDTNFQDFYSYFGNLLLYVIKWSEYVNLDFRAKNSFSLNYLHNYHLSYSNLSPEFDDSIESDKTIVNNYNSLVKDWIQALFDDSEGLSDDLIRSIDIKQIYQLIPLIYQEAILAYVYGKINFKILQNGLDYLSQNFLLPCNISIVNWLAWKINLNNKNMENYVSVLNEMITMTNKVKSESNNELKIQSEVILEIITDTAAESLQHIDIAPSIISNELITSKFKSHNEASSALSPCNFEEFESNFFKAINGKDANYELLDSYINNNQQLIRNFLLSLNSNTARTNSKENIKFLIDLVLFLEINKSVRSNGDKQYWIKRFTDLKSDTTNYESSVKFEKSIDHHYSSIFNIDNDDGDAEEDNGAGMDDRDDELFESISMDYCVNEMGKYNVDLADLLNLLTNYKTGAPNESVSRYLHLIHNKLLADLTGFQC